MSGTDNERWVEEARARQDIRETILRYFRGIDRGDRALHGSAFAPDAKLFIDGIQRRGPGTPPAEQQPDPIGVPVERIMASSHHLHQSDVRLEDDRAYVESNATAYLLLRGDSQPAMIVRGLRYLDRFARIEDAWLIVERHHTVDWMYRTNAEIAKDLAARASFPAWLDAQKATA